jgi:hypothetical protein
MHPFCGEARYATFLLKKICRKWIQYGLKDSQTEVHGSTCKKTEDNAGHHSTRYVTDPLHFIVEFLECTTSGSIQQDPAHACVDNYCSYCFCTARYPLLSSGASCSLKNLFRVRYLHLIVISGGNGWLWEKMATIGQLTGPFVLAMPYCFQNLYHQSCCNLWLAPLWGGSNLGRATQKFKPISVLSTSPPLPLSW